MAEVEASLRHLQAELVRIDVRIRREVRRWQLAGQDPADSFRGLHLSDAEAGLLSERPFGASWGQMAALPPDDTEAFAQLEAQAAHQAQQLAEAAWQEGQVLRLERLATTFGLDRFDVDTLLICLAPALDLRYERLYAYLQDDVTRKRPTVSLVLDLLGGLDPAGRLPLLLRFAGDAPLFKYHLLERVSDSAPDLPLLGQALGVDPAIVAWLLGGYQPHAELGPYVTLWRPPPPTSPHSGNWREGDVGQPDAGDGDANTLLAGRAWPDLERALAMESSVGKQPVVVFYGPDLISRQAAARLLAARTERPLLTVDLGAVTAGGLPSLRAMRLALRDARLTGAVPCLTGWDVCLAPGGGTPDGPVRSSMAGSSPPPDLLAELCAYPDLAVVAGQVAWQAGGVERDRPLVWIELAAPGYAERRALWQHFLRQQAQVSEMDLSALAGQFHLTAAQIRDAVASARDWAAQTGERLHSSSLLAAARAHSNPRLASLARKIVPRFTWRDIVLPDDQLTLLHEIVATVRGRALVLEEWGVGRKLASSPGVTMLFSGPPGTGKTMAAEVIAAELSLDLYKIDLSTVVSKYIGETEKNLEQIFGEAQSSNAILFFDEADAIFGKRSEVKDAHDRYANIEISYLLQRMESYDGVTILATNLRANLDEAFTRRLQFAVDMPFPDEGYRLRIWQTLLPPGVPSEPDLDFELLARRFKLAGGNIRNILVSAAYLAAADGGRLGMKHLLHGTRRELQKMGRLVNERDMTER
jgi:ATP-dependent 26S proteasome regulatory subunit